jgi:hypothetical protein
MLTIFTIPKPFKGHIGVIQRNAIKSWTMLEPKPEIILLGNDEGVADAAREFGAIHLPRIAANEYGTPLLNDMFRQAEAAAGGEWMCYVNTDILLPGDLFRAIDRVRKECSACLMVSKRLNIDQTEPIDFHGNWQEPLMRLVQKTGTSGQHTAIDVFVFPRGFYKSVPDFAIGRFWFDQWLIKDALLNGFRVVDLSPVAPVLHQNHNYNHVAGGEGALWTGKEADHNFRLYGSVYHAYTLLDITHELQADGKVKRIRFRRLRYKLWEKTVHDTAAIRHRLGLRRRKGIDAAAKQPMV